MFAKAITKVRPFTHPLITLKRLLSNEVACGCATFIILNPEGYALTAAHVMRDASQAAADNLSRNKLSEEIEKIKSDSQLGVKQKKKRLSTLHENPQWIINFSYWWGQDQYRGNAVAVDGMADLALVKLEPFNRESVGSYPIFRSSKDELLVGTSLCKLGFPFHKIDATFDEQNRRFKIAEGVLPLPLFPIDGIHTRVAAFVYPGGRQVKFLETSTPGLMGQSGGPIFDPNGNICALQSRTIHFPLGFSPKIKVGNREVEEHQFLNVGLGTHVDEIMKFLIVNKISFNTSD